MSDRREMILKMMSAFPGEFGLRAFPGKRFRISEGDSYVNDYGVVMLYTEILNSDGKWSSWCKGTSNELTREIVK